MKKLIGGRVHFAGSEVTAELTKEEMEKAPVTFSNKGARMMRTKAQDILIFGGTNMSVIKPIWAEVEDVEPEVAVIKKAEMEEHDFTPDIERAIKKQEESPKKKTQDEILAEMTAKSNCKHEPEKMVLYRQHTAKGIRYFPKCDFCGKRERYVSESKIVKGDYAGTPNEKWTEQDIIDAIDWIED